MIAAYYTFRPLQKEMWAVCKWNGGREPETIYYVDYLTSHCTCAAPSKCKHKQCVDQIYSLKMKWEMYEWKWDEKNTWTLLTDMVDIDEKMEAL